MNNKKIAIYSRKSKFTGKGESIENQIELCKIYISTHYSGTRDNDILIFEDEGYSGGHLDRPKFKEMMSRVHKKEISHIICYRLDRISRNIGDFASLIEELNELHTDFISIKEQFDTSSPMGRAMMYIASVFSQLERETIAERIRDNMRELAKTGRWLGGVTPTGYTSQAVEKITIDGKVKKAFKLVPIEEEINMVKLIFRKFLEYNSLTKTETYLIQNGFKTKNDRDFSRFTIKSILTNPVYMIADKSAYDFFIKEKVEVFSNLDEFDNRSGIMAYNKTIQKRGKANEKREMSDWIIAVGKHDGIISGEDFTMVHNMINENKNKNYRKARSHIALLSGILVCGECNNFMRPKLSQRKNKDGELIYNYLCSMKERSRMEKCNMKNPNGNTLDKLVCDEIKKLSYDPEIFLNELQKQKKNYTANSSSAEEEISRLNKIKTNLETDITKLTKTLVKVADTTSEKHILKEIDELDHDLNNANESIVEYEKILNSNVMTENDFEILKDLLTNFSNTFDDMSIEQKRRAIKTLIKKVVWDGENVHIYLFGSTEDYIDFTSTSQNKPLCKHRKRNTNVF